jgi:[ribosomal protein S5]-alanine N-acetyltransferase
MQRLVVDELTLEPLLPIHAAAMYEVLKDPELYRYLDYAPPPSAEHLRDVYERLQARKSPDGTQHWLNWVVRVNDGAPIGYVQATVEGDGSAWIGVVFSREHGGRGYATRATGTVLEHLSETWDVTRFLATIEQANEGSIRLFERLGFRDASEEERCGHAVAASERFLLRR